MDVTDYSLKLQDARNKFSKAAEDLSLTYKQNEERLEKLSEERAKSQQASYMKQRQEVKDTFEKVTKKTICRS